MIDRKVTPLNEILARTPTPEVVARLDRWLRANPNEWIRLYHGTDAQVPVREQGLRPTSARRRNSLQSRSGYVSLSLFPGHAELFAKLAFPQRAVTVYGVDLRVGELVPDLDQLRNQRLWAERAMKPAWPTAWLMDMGRRSKGRWRDHVSSF